MANRDVSLRDFRNLFIFLALGLLMLMVIFEGLAVYYGIIIPLLPLLFVLLGFVSAGMIFIAEF